MTRETRFTFLCNEIERQTLAQLALTLQRSQSDAVRWLVSNAARELAAANADEAHHETQTPISA